MILGALLKRLAPRLGARVLLEPEWGLAGQITFRNGRRSYFRYNTMDLNPVGASDIAKDKDFSNFFLRSMGYPIVPGSRTFFSPRWAAAIGATDRGIDAALAHARTIGFPVVVKPNSGSQGSGVALVRNRREFLRAARNVFRDDRVCLVQNAVAGNDYRVVVLDDAVISAYRRVPLSVVGNGRSSIGALLSDKQRGFDEALRDTRIDLADPRIAVKLAHGGRTLRSVPARGETVFALDNANLSTGGDAIDVTKEVHPRFAELAVRVTSDMGLRLCGVDFMIDGTIDERPDRYWILEVNAAPGLDHYARSGRAQERIVERLYLRVLQHLDGGGRRRRPPGRRVNAPARRTAGTRATR